MITPDWYRDWRHEAFHQLQDKNGQIEARFRMGHWPRYDYDVETCKLVFSEDGKPKVIADIQVVGTTSENAGNWLWGWANAHWPAACVEDGHKVREFGTERGVPDLINDYVEDKDINALGWELTAVAARICGAVGAYRPASERGGLFLMFRDIQWAG